MKSRGSIGESWWARRFIEPLEASADSGRISRGRSYARKGAVFKLDVSPGRVVAQVVGQRLYSATIGFTPLDDETWDVVSAALAGKALFRAALMAGELPAEVEGVFAEAGAELFPHSLYDLDVSCNCPDWGYPCKHAAAVLYTLADRLDGDPFLLLAWLGRDRATLLESIRAHAEGGEHASGTSGSGLEVQARPLAECVDDFYAAADPVRPPALSRTLDPVSHADTDIPGLVAALTPMYERLKAGGPGDSGREDAG